MNSNGEQAEVLFEKLRALRLRLANREGMPAYLVFTDKSLREMAATAPVTKDAFLQIHGVGDTKLQQYGQEFLELIRSHVSSVSNETTNPAASSSDSAESKPEKGRETTKSALQTVGGWLKITLSLVADWLIWLMIHLPHPNERLLLPTRREPLRRGLKHELKRIHNFTCVYCGHRKPPFALQIDHMVPLTRGGSNEQENLQVTCRPCNWRKGIHTDEEFRDRYSRLVPTERLTPPSSPISQAELTAETQRTTQPNTVRKFRRSRFISKREKILAGCVVVFGVTAWILAVSLHYLGLTGLNLAVPPVVTGAALGFGVWRRAEAIGAMIEEE